MNNRLQTIEAVSENYETAILGGGCFWCVEAVFQRLDGVLEVEPGYTGGHEEEPSYEAVCSGTTGHAEVVKLTFDTRVLSYYDLLEVFFITHDPTTLNCQGSDVGTHYRSAIFPTSKGQEEIAVKIIKELELSGVYEAKIVSTIEKLRTFYPAEEYHQNYFNNNSQQLYCTMVVKPKILELEAAFSEKVKA